jgi:hypothetical protein
VTGYEEQILLSIFFVNEDCKFGMKVCFSVYFAVDETSLSGIFGDYAHRNDKTKSN